MKNECLTCLRNLANKLLLKYQVDEEMATELLSQLNAYISKYENDGLSSPEASRFLNLLVKKAVNDSDLYREEKEYFNTLMLSLEDEIRKIIKQSDDPFKMALRYALAGNVIDVAPSNSFDIHQVLAEALTRKPAIDHSKKLKEELKKASTVLYLGDNAGEIVLDKLFIETIGHPDIYFATRGGNIINDVTLEDAKKVGIEKFAKVISNGYDAPSTILKRCSPEFLEVFGKAGVIISKGQGNLEGLINVKDNRIFFLFMVKCGVIADMIGVKERSTVVLNRS